MAPTAPQDSIRLFFAAWPAPGVQRELHEVAASAQRECGGRAVAQRNIHLTLSFLGDVERRRLGPIEAIAAEIRGAPAELRLDRLEFWRHNRILWAGVDRCPEALRDTAGRLAAGLRGAGFRTGDRPFVPHVTLLRNARRGPAQAAIPAISWRVDALSLVESVHRDGQRRYGVLRQWPLAP